MLEGSVTLAALAALYDKMSKAFFESYFIKKFFSPEEGESLSKSSVLYRLFRIIQLFGVRLFSVLYLDRLFSGSIFKNVYFWCVLPILLAPVLPTMGVIALAVMGFLSLIIRTFSDKNEKLEYFAINKFIYVFAGIYLFSIISSVTPSGSLLGGGVYVLFTLFFIVVTNAVKARKKARLMIFVLALMGAAVSLYGFYQFMFPAKFGGMWVDEEMFSDIGLRVYSTFGNPNVLGAYLLLIIPLAAAGFINSKKTIKKAFYLLAASMMLLSLMLTYSRGCYLGIMFAAGIFLVLLDRRFIILGLLGLLALPFVMPQTIIDRFLSIGNMADSSTSYRVFIWFGTIAMLKDYWISGIGPGQAAYNMVYPAYGYNGISAPHAHNLFLQLMCDAGIMALLAFLAIVYKFYKAVLYAVKNEKSKEARVYNIAAVSAISGFLLQSLFDYTFYNYRVMFMFWVVLALGVIFSRYGKLNEGADYFD